MITPFSLYSDKKYVSYRIIEYTDEVDNTEEKGCYNYKSLSSIMPKVPTTKVLSTKFGIQKTTLKVVSARFMSHCMRTTLVIYRFIKLK